MTGFSQGDQRPMAPGLLRLLRHGTSARALLSRRGLSSLGANCAMRDARGQQVGGEVANRKW